ncbi:hypothetical protein CGCSCA4_v012206 [Colletotrichum siamense]|uniref:Uncharacterized protein n=1 Tax=Colletotrichum siamense TaxID=690259 RepID=A0A9P5BSX4_COLSI|nr:hypothetical protein CGCSCA4_v012206 [Colletotrichum siamense]KAF4850680.1 hypothetical protein CGCSCA2_v011297 [Colletotrichum siamense]
MGFACCRYHRPPTTTTLSSPSFLPLMQVYGKASWLRTLPRAHTYRETERAESPPMQCASPASFLVPDPNWLLRRRCGVSSPLQRTPAARCSCSCSSPLPTAPQNKLTLARRLIDGQIPHPASSTRPTPDRRPSSPSLQPMSSALCLDARSFGHTRRVSWHRWLRFCSFAAMLSCFTSSPPRSHLDRASSPLCPPRQAVMLLKSIKQPHNNSQHFLFRLFSFFLFSFQVFVIVIVVAFPKPDFLDFF